MLLLGNIEASIVTALDKIGAAADAIRDQATSATRIAHEIHRPVSVVPPWILATLGADARLVEWAGTRTLAETWADCEQGEWLLWLAARAGVDRRLVVRAACEIARTTLRHVPVCEDRPRLAIDAAEAWARGEATIDEVRTTAAAAFAAAFAGMRGPADRATRAASYCGDEPDVAVFVAGMAEVEANNPVPSRDYETVIRRLIPWAAVETARQRGARSEWCGRIP